MKRILPRLSFRKFFVRNLVLLTVIFFSVLAHAGDSNYMAWPDSPDKPKLLVPKMVWEMELKTGLWIPEAETFKSFFGDCCVFWNRLQGGVLFQRRYGIEGSAGFVYTSGQAQGAVNGQPSADRFRLIFVPMELSAVWRADYFDWRGVIPFVKLGGDGVFFRENTAGNVVSGMRYGFHGGGGMQINLLMFSDTLYESREDYGLQDAFFTLEAAYHKINNFGSSDVNLSGVIYSAGFLFEF